VPPLSESSRLPKDERRLAGLREHAAFASEELSALGGTGAAEDAVGAEWFDAFQSGSWKVDGVYNGTEVWRLPGERIHRIMGVRDVEGVTPLEAMDLFKDTAKIFERLFPLVDPMFCRGSVLVGEGVTGPDAICHGVFKLPAVVGEGSAPGFPPRDFIWRHRCRRLPTGSVLMTARSVEEGSELDRTEVNNRGKTIRGVMYTTGYYGRQVRDGPVPLTRVWYIVQADPKGIIPGWLINFAAGKQAQNVTRLAKIFE